MATVIIPAALRKFTNDHAKVVIEGSNVNDVLSSMMVRYPELKTHLTNADGRTPSFINIFVNDNDIRHLDNVDTRVTNEAVITIVAAIAGG